MEKHLILIDLDGTLLDEKKKISEENKQAILDVQKLGHTVIISTGRAHYRSHMYYEELGLKSLIVNRNACFIHGPHDKDFLPVYKWLEEEIVLDFINGEIAEYTEKMYLEYLNKVYVKKGEKGFYAQYPLCELEDYDKQPITKNTNLISLTIQNENLEKVIKILETYDIIIEQFPFYQERTIINIYPNKSDKANAYKTLSDYYKVPQQRIIAIGDGQNDINMIKHAGVGVAMKNGIEEVKSLSKVITDYTNDESGVGRFLNKYFQI